MVSKTGDHFFSVIVPTYNRPDLLSNCLEKLDPSFQSIEPGKYEVIVTDDGKQKSAEPMIREKYSWVKWTAGPGRGVASNRNHAVRMAKGSWIVFVDDDCLPTRNWLSTIIGFAEKNSFDVIEGKTIIPDKVDNPFRFAPENLTGDHYWSCNLAFLKTTFDQMGGFDEDCSGRGQDYELAMRIRNRHLRTHFSENAIVHHPTRPIGFGFLWKQAFNLDWYLLCDHKNGYSVPVEKNVFLALWHVSRQKFLSMARRTWHYFRYWDSSQWKTRTFNLVWAYLILPLEIPYIWYSEIKIRKFLLERKKDGFMKRNSA